MAKRIDKWFKAGIHMGWEKKMSQKDRRAVALKAHKKDYLATARALNQIANVTQDKETAYKARLDAEYFFKRYRIMTKKSR